MHGFDQAMAYRSQLSTQVRPKKPSMRDQLCVIRRGKVVDTNDPWNRNLIVLVWTPANAGGEALVWQKLRNHDRRRQFVTRRHQHHARQQPIRQA